MEQAPSADTNKTAALLIGIPALLFAVGFILYGNISTFNLWRTDRLLQREGVEVQAAVLHTNLVTSTRSIGYCEVIFEYAFAGTRPKQKSTRVDSSFCGIFEAGDTVTAIAHPTRLNVADLVWGGYIESRLIIFFLLDSLLILLPIGFLISQQLNRQTERENEALLSTDFESLPFTISRPRGNAIMDWGCIFPFATVLTTLLGGACVVGVLRFNEMGAGLSLVLICSAVPFLGIGLLLLYQFFKGTALTYTFTHTAILVSYRLGDKAFDPATIQTIQAVTRTVRSSESHFARITFKDQQTVDIDVPKNNLSQIVYTLSQLYKI